MAIGELFQRLAARARWASASCALSARSASLRVAASAGAAGDRGQQRRQRRARAADEAHADRPVRREPLGGRFDVNDLRARRER
jgi:hypothetical protein